MGWGGSGAPSHSSKRPNKSHEKTKRAARAAHARTTVSVGALKPQGRSAKKQRMMDKRARFAAMPLAPSVLTPADVAMLVEKSSKFQPKKAT